MTLAISDLIKQVGDDNVTFQNLDEASISMDYDLKKGTTIKFGTNVRLNLDGTELLGLVVWLPRDKVIAVIDATTKRGIV